MEGVMRVYSIVVDVGPRGRLHHDRALSAGCITQGETVEQCVSNAQEAIALSVEDLVAAGEPVPEETEHPQLLLVTVAA